MTCFRVPFIEENLNHSNTSKEYYTFSTPRLKVQNTVYVPDSIVKCYLNVPAYLLSTVCRHVYYK